MLQDRHLVRLRRLFKEIEAVTEEAARERAVPDGRSLIDVLSEEAGGDPALVEARLDEEATFILPKLAPGHCPACRGARGDWGGVTTLPESRWRTCKVCKGSGRAGP